jgi:hypothetical protein
MTQHFSNLTRFFLTLWAVAAFLSAVAHLVAPLFMSAGTSWPYAYGWQREIAFFDIALAGYIALQLRSALQPELARLMYCLAGLSLCLGLNHFLSAINGGWGYLHLAGSVTNALAVFFATFVFVRSR